MPGYKGHLVGGLFVFALLYFFLFVVCVHFYSFLFAVELLSVTLLGSLFPDIDIKSKGQRYFYLLVMGSLLVLSIRKHFFLATLIGIAITMPLIVPHRGLFHHPLFLMGLVVFLWLILSCLWPVGAQQTAYHFLFFMSGILSHIWLDIGPKRFFKKLRLR